MASAPRPVSFRVRYAAPAADLDPDMRRRLLGPWAELAFTELDVAAGPSVLRASWTGKRPMTLLLELHRRSRLLLDDDAKRWQRIEPASAPAPDDAPAPRPFRAGVREILGRRCERWIVPTGEGALTLWLHRPPRALTAAAREVLSILAPFPTAALRDCRGLPLALELEGTRDGRPYHLALEAASYHEDDATPPDFRPPPDYRIQDGRVAVDAPRPNRAGAAPSASAPISLLRLADFGVLLNPPLFGKLRDLLNRLAPASPFGSVVGTDGIHRLPIQLWYELAGRLGHVDPQGVDRTDFLVEFAEKLWFVLRFGRHPSRPTVLTEEERTLCGAVLFVLRGEPPAPPETPTANDARTWMLGTRFVIHRGQHLTLRQYVEAQRTRFFGDRPIPDDGLEPFAGFLVSGPAVWRRLLLGDESGLPVQLQELAERMGDGPALLPEDRLREIERRILGEDGNPEAELGPSQIRIEVSTTATFTASGFFLSVDLTGPDPVETLEPDLLVLKVNRISVDFDWSSATRNNWQAKVAAFLTGGMSVVFATNTGHGHASVSDARLALRFRAEGADQVKVSIDAGRSVLPWSGEVIGFNLLYPLAMPLSSLLLEPIGTRVLEFALSSLAPSLIVPELGTRLLALWNAVRGPVPDDRTIFVQSAGDGVTGSLRSTGVPAAQFALFTPPRSHDITLFVSDDYLRHWVLQRARLGRVDLDPAPLLQAVGVALPSAELHPLAAECRARLQDHSRDELAELLKDRGMNRREIAEYFESRVPYPFGDYLLPPWNMKPEPAVGPSRHEFRLRFQPITVTLPASGSGLPPTLTTGLRVSLQAIRELLFPWLSYPAKGGLERPSAVRPPILPVPARKQPLEWTLRPADCVLAELLTYEGRIDAALKFGFQGRLGILSPVSIAVDSASLSVVHGATTGQGSLAGLAPAALQSALRPQLLAAYRAAFDGLLTASPGQPGGIPEPVDASTVVRTLARVFGVAEAVAQAITVSAIPAPLTDLAALDGTAGFETSGRWLFWKVSLQEQVSGLLRP